MHEDPTLKMLMSVLNPSENEEEKVSSQESKTVAGPEDKNDELSKPSVDDKSTKARGNELEFPPGIDIELRHVVSLANMGKAWLSCPVTVLVKGVQVSGQVVAGREAQKWYMRTLLEGIKTQAKPDPSLGMPPHEQDAISAPIRKLAEDFLPRVSERVDSLPPVKRIEFLSLKRARVWTPGSQEPMRSEMIRIRLDRIDAFTLGEPDEDGTG
jgi:hypothetical protein